jgi:hypothetical protein
MRTSFSPRFKGAPNALPLPQLMELVLNKNVEIAARMLKSTGMVLD